jgi:hypothetical protein
VIDETSPQLRSGRPAPSPRRSLADIIRDPGRAAAAVALALLLGWRLHHLDARALFFDEAFSWQLTRFPWPEMVARARQDVHPLLYYAELKVWTGALGDSVLAMRALSVAWFGVALWGTSLLCREAGLARSRPPAGLAGPAPWRDDAGPIAMLLLAASPLLFRYCQEVRMYTQEVALVIVSSWLLLRALRETARPGRWWAAYGLAAAALAHTHNFALFSLAAQAGFAAGLILLAAVRRGQAPWRSPTARWGLGAGLLVATLYLPWLPTLLRQRARVAEDYWATPVSHRAPTSPKVWRPVILRCVTQAQDEGPLSSRDEWLADGLLLMAAGTLVLLACRGDRLGWLLVAGVVVPVALAVALSHATGRNLIVFRFFMPPVALLLIGLGLLLGAVGPGPLRWGLAALVAGNLALCTAFFVESLGLPGRAESRAAADYVAAHRRPGDRVVGITAVDFLPLKYHARGRFDVRLAVAPGLPALTHYRGAPVLQPGDLLRWRGAAEPPRGRVWFLGSDSDHSKLPKPRAWARLDELHLPETIRWRGEAVLELWGPRPPGPTREGRR